MVDAEYGLAASAMNNDNIEPVLIAFFMQKILQFSWLIGNNDFRHCFLGGKVVKIYNVSYWLFFRGNASV